MASDLIRALPTLGERKPMAVSKWDKVTPSEKQDTERKADEKALRTWRAGVQRRDGKTCRCCGRLLTNTLSAAPERRECHHIAGRADAAVRYDVRNGIQVCLGCHEQIERGRIHLFQKKAHHMFKVGAKAYVNGNKPVQFVKKETA